MPFNLGNYSPSYNPTGCLVSKTVILNNRLFRRTTYRTGQQMLNMALKYVIARILQADVEIDAIGPEINVILTLQ